MSSAHILKKIGFFLATLLFSFSIFARENTLPTVAYANLPREAQTTILLIRKGGPYPYAKDGVVFGNYEKALPKKKRGYYHEFTVKTSGVRSRGARRIIAGGDLQQVRDYYYTDDHYASFKRVTE